MFGLIGHSTNLEEARNKASFLGYEEYARGDLDMWCSAPPQLVERITVTSPTGKQIEGAYIDSVFVPEMLGRFKTARRKVLNGKDADFDAASEFQWRFFQTAKPLATDLVIPDERLNYVQDLHLRFDVQKRKLLLAEVADMSLARDAIARLT